MILANVAAALPGEQDFHCVDIAIKGDKIAAIKEAGSLTIGAAENTDVIDCTGLFAFPGAIDPHVHFDEPGFTHREDFLHGSAEAAKGGVTTVIDMPCTSLPPVTSIEALTNKLSIVKEKAIIDYAFYGGINGQMEPAQLQDSIASLAPQVVGFKSYFISGMESFPAVNDEQFARAVRACAKEGRPLLLHAEDPDVVADATRELAQRHRTTRQNAGSNGALHQWVDYYASRPMDAEIAAVLRAMKLADHYTKYVHIVHVGTAGAALAAS